MGGADNVGECVWLMSVCGHGWLPVSICLSVTIVTSVTDCVCLSPPPSLTRLTKVLMTVMVVIMREGSVLKPSTTTKPVSYKEYEPTLSVHVPVHIVLYSVCPCIPCTIQCVSVYTLYCTVCVRVHFVLYSVCPCKYCTVQCVPLYMHVSWMAEGMGGCTHPLTRHVFPCKSKLCHSLSMQLVMMK